MEIEQKYSTENGVEYNYDSYDVGFIFEELVGCEGIPEDLKQKLYFLQSDQYFIYLETFIERCTAKTFSGSNRLIFH